MEFRNALKSLPSVSMVWPGSSRQLSNKYTTGTPSETRYGARLPKSSDALAATGQAPVKPSSQPLRSTTGGRVEPVGTVTRGFTTTVRADCRWVPAAPVAERFTVYSPGFIRRDAPSRIWFPARFGDASSPLPEAEALV